MTPAEGLPAELARLAAGLEPLNGAGRSAVVWDLSGEEPAVLYAGRYAQAHLVDAATERLRAGEHDFEIDGEPGLRGKVVVCGRAGERAAYGLFLHGAGRPHVGSTLEDLIAAAERSIGRPVAGMSRAEKQEVVAFLNERGVFMIRKAVEDVAERLGVTRFTVYNYLERLSFSPSDAMVEEGSTHLDEESSHGT